MSEIEGRELTSGKSKEQSMIAAIEKGLDQYQTKMESTYGAYWNSRSEVIKTVISLASGSVALTVTFSSSLVSAQKSGGWKYLLFASWILYLLSIVFGIVCLWLSTGLKATPIHFFNRRKRIREALPKINRESLSEPIMPILQEVFATIERSDHWAQGFSAASLITFILAFLLLGLFGWKQFAT